MESKGQFKERIKREGRWKAFITRRDELKRSGYAPKDAYEATVKEFSPLEPGAITDEPTEIQDDADGFDIPPAVPLPPFATAGRVGDGDLDDPDDGLASLDQFAGKGQANIREVVQWVFEHLAVRDVTADMAPSSGAWGLLQWAKRPINRTEFYRTLYAKFIPSKSQLDNEKFDDDGREQLGILDRIKKTYRNAVLPPRPQRPGS